jgi:putative oxidoreductase
VNIGLLILRLAVGLTLAAHGCQKLFGWFGGGGIAGTATFLEKLRLRPGHGQAILVGFSETVGGLLLALGLLTPVAAAMAIGIMLVATVTVHLKKGFFAGKGGFEFNLTIAAAALALAFTGPGSLSIDRLAGVARASNLWGAAALGAGLLGGGIILLLRSAAGPTNDAA